MLTLTYADLKSQLFGEAVQKLASIKALPHKVSYQVAKIYKALGPEEEVVSGLYDKLLEQYAEKDPDGRPVTERPGVIRLLPATSKEFNEKVREFWKETVTIDRPKLDLKHFISELTPKEIAVLDPLWGEVDEGALKG